MSIHLNRDELEKLREAKRSRSFWRLNSSETVEHELQGQFGPSSYAYVRFECVPSDYLSFDVTASWPSTVPKAYDKKLELAVAEGVADVLLEDVYQHSGCTVVLVDVRYDEIGSSEAAFMMASASAMRSLLSRKWIPVGKSQTINSS
jgi:hypothetical protein